MAKKLNKYFEIFYFMKYLVKIVLHENSEKQINWHKENSYF